MLKPGPVGTLGVPREWLGRCICTVNFAAAEAVMSCALQISQPLTPLVDEFAGRLFGELDYVQEGQNCERFAELYGHVPRVRTPGGGLQCFCSSQRRRLPGLSQCHTSQRSLPLWPSVLLRWLQRCKTF